MLTLLLLVASATGGLAHRAPLTPDDVALQAHAQVWGLADPALCADAGDSELAGPTRCDACRLVAAALLPDPALPLLLRGQALPLAWAAPEPLRTSFAARPAHPARAPPRG
ncbi:polyketide synthase [Frigidibacter sp.]|uniref:polyketide synthase n=1 Tax=Frigidibacter sp. TaxID=2586418 RepID=UPI002734FB52|nr:polyketide synthase [Frigidibacter sp.]MDP3341270.1 polyketide synthase [Frigidibacter sp.]